VIFPEAELSLQQDERWIVKIEKQNLIQVEPISGFSQQQYLL
jgi:hypothetical protein